MCERVLVTGKEESRWPLLEDVPVWRNLRLIFSHSQQWEKLRSRNYCNLGPGHSTSTSCGWHARNIDPTLSNPHYLCHSNRTKHRKAVSACICSGAMAAIGYMLAVVYVRILQTLTCLNQNQLARRLRLSLNLACLADFYNDQRYLYGMVYPTEVRLLVLLAPGWLRRSRKNLISRSYWKFLESTALTSAMIFLVLLGANSSTH